MIEIRLHHQLAALDSCRRGARLWRRLAVCWAVLAAAGLLLFVGHRVTGANTVIWWWLLIAGGLIAAIVIWSRAQSVPADLPALAAQLDRDNPELQHLLSTAVQQEPDPDTGRFNFLQQRVIDAAVRHRHRDWWEQDLRRKLSSARKLHAAALAACILVFALGGGSSHLLPSGHHPWLTDEITITPGDTTMERGAGLVITAQFGRRPPAEATLVLVTASGKTKRLPLARHLADPVFGTSIPQVTEDGLYRVEYSTTKTRDFKIKVFDYPALVRSDASLHFPDYTGLTNRVIRDTRRVSAIEGTRLTYTMELNKPVVRAQLVGKDQTLVLAVQSNAVATLNDWTLTNSGRFALELVDAEGRTNRTPPEFSLQALPDRPPVVKLTFPRGDQRVSRLEELELKGETSDEFGLLNYGVGFSIAGQDPQFVELGKPAGPNEKRQFSYQMALEKLGVDVDQIVSYFAWADDHGPDGQTRRTFSDIYFAEVRPFDEIFRADQSGDAESGGGGGQNGGSQGGGNNNVRLTELQKQIVIATWQLQREKPGAAGRKQSVK